MNDKIDDMIKQGYKILNGESYFAGFGILVNKEYFYNLITELERMYIAYKIHQEGIDIHSKITRDFCDDFYSYLTECSTQTTDVNDIKELKPKNKDLKIIKIKERRGYKRRMDYNTDKLKSDVADYFNKYIKTHDDNIAIVQNSDYTNWLLRFMNEHNLTTLIDNSYDYNHDISADDLEKVQLLYYFAEYVDDIAREKEIRDMSNDDDENYMYYIKINGEKFTIVTYNGGQGTFSVIAKYNNKDNHNWIEF